MVFGNVLPCRQRSELSPQAVNTCERKREAPPVLALVIRETLDITPSVLLASALALESTVGSEAVASNLPHLGTIWIATCVILQPCPHLDAVLRERTKWTLSTRFGKNRKHVAQIGVF